MNYRRGDIVWVKFPFSDASSGKVRALLLLFQMTQLITLVIISSCRLLQD